MFGSHAARRYPNTYLSLRDSLSLSIVEKRTKTVKSVIETNDCSSPDEICVCMIMDETNRNSMKLDIEAVRLSENDHDQPTETYKQVSEFSSNEKSTGE